jgi:glutathione synthase/RimK-type ligase-like ATP-grasp enzyme
LHFCLITRFHSHHSTSSFVARLVHEAERAGHQFSIVNPADITLAFDGPNQFPVKVGDAVFPTFDLVHYALRWDDDFAWDIIETLKSWGHNVLPATRIPLGDSVTMARLMARSGVNAPRTWVLAQANQLPVILNDLHYPCMFKIRPSRVSLSAKNAAATGGRKVYFANNSAEAVGIAHSLERTLQDIMVQEVPTPVGEDTRAFVVGNKIVAAVNRRAPVGLSRPLEEGNPTVVSTVLSGTEQTLVLAAAKLYAAPYAAVSILRIPGQPPLLLELSRAPALTEAEQATGVNIAGAIIAYCATQVQTTLAKRAQS